MIFKRAVCEIRTIERETDILKCRFFYVTEVKPSSQYENKLLDLNFDTDPNEPDSTNNCKTATCRIPMQNCTAFTV